jgi:hypothetical protein
MKTIHIDLLLVGLVIWIVAACHHPPQVVTETRTEYKEVIRDSTIYLSDSSMLYAWLECDSVGQAHIREIAELRAGKMVFPEVIIKNNYLKTVCKVDSFQVFVRLKDRYTVKEEVKKPPPERVNYVTGFQWFQIWAGRVLIVILIIAGILKLIRMKTGGKFV